MEPTDRTDPTGPTPSPAGETVDEATTSPPADDLVVEELLVEEISIDGMCGVY